MQLVVDMNITDLDMLPSQKGVISFLEELEATTTDPKTADKIRSFLIERGIWEE